MSLMYTFGYPLSHAYFWKINTINTYYVLNKTNKNEEKQI